MTNSERLEVRIDSAESGYTVRVSWRHWEESFEFTMPYLQNELSQILEKLGTFDNRGRPTASNEELLEIGEKLYYSLFPTEGIRSIVTRCLSAGLGSTDMDLIYKDQEVGKIPWELLAHKRSEHERGRFLVTSGELNLVRVIDIQDPFREVSVRSPLKILVVVARPLDQHYLERTPPIEAIKEGLEWG